MTKDEIRQSRRAWRQNLSENERRSRSRRICENIRLHLAPYRAVMAFLPIDNEPNILPILRELHEKDYQVLVPFMENGYIQPALFDPKYPYESAKLECTLWTGDPSTIGTILIPGVAFDLLGNRIGFGKGHYDRFLEHFSRKTMKYGVAYQEQVLGRIPKDRHDHPVHFVITDKY